MDNLYEMNSKIFKALGDSKRLEIVSILAKGEKCACELLEYFNFTQPTLSHHMRVLMECGIVEVKKVGTWNHYSLNRKNANRLVLFLLGTITE
ncbi:ArsR/SmtB family transcription factor [Clostridium massiliamazoniense]|uniref:ArsR/SmtB family transcription factor n=1 Tax=Clostridium massiliamazoniense TaxID=1347366 RepID=UPI0006D772D0|nr:metalloregulator ArsR/SmtB family transcription factor [Clostridium massiliamazoniense]